MNRRPTRLRPADTRRGSWRGRSRSIPYGRGKGALAPGLQRRSRAGGVTRWTCPGNDADAYGSGGRGDDALGVHAVHWTAFPRLHATTRCTWFATFVFIRTRHVRLMLQCGRVDRHVRPVAPHHGSEGWSPHLPHRRPPRRRSGRPGRPFPPPRVADRWWDGEHPREPPSGDLPPRRATASLPGPPVGHPETVSGVNEKYRRRSDGAPATRWGRRD